jgi:anaerobic ribonucleoside-triphosphate reductase
VLCPEFTACSNCGRTSRGSYGQCGTCGSDRVEGLAYGAGRYGYTSGWERSRLAELHDRHRVNKLNA